MHRAVTKVTRFPEMGRMCAEKSFCALRLRLRASLRQSGMSGGAAYPPEAVGYPLSSREGGTGVSWVQVQLVSPVCRAHPFASQKDGAPTSILIDAERMGRPARRERIKVG